MRTLYIVAFILLMASCQQNLEIPFEINKRIVVSQPCNFFGYSINRDRFFVPEFFVGSFNSIYSQKPTRLEIINDRSAYIQSISCDCKKVASLVEATNNNGYYLAYSDLRTGNNEFFQEEGGVRSPAFSPRETLLAYISVSEITIYDYKRRKNLELGPTDINFRALTWSLDGAELLLEDADSNIWSYDIKLRKYCQLVQAKSFFYGNRNIISDDQNPDIFYYLDDTKTGFNDIYRFEKGKGSSLFYASASDKYLLNYPQSKDGLYFRSVENGNVLINKLTPKGVTYISEKGVYYDYFKTKSGVVFSLYSNVGTPATFDVSADGKTVYKGPNATIDNTIIPIAERNGEGMTHFIYKPKEKIKAWAVYLHGGPWEQNQERYNVYINSLVDKGIAIIVLNYLGSTGIGNIYESREDSNLLSNQILNVHRDLRGMVIKYRISGKVSLIGVSYGAKIAHGYADSYSAEINSVVDLSGTEDSFKSYKAKRLFIYGDNDFMIADKDRLAMLSKASLLKSTRIEVYRNETHYIAQRKNMVRTIDLISDFITH